VADDLASLSKTLTTMANGLRGEAARAVLTAVGVEARKIADHEAGRALGSDQRFSGWRTGKVGAGFEFEGDNKIVLEARPNGPAVVAEDGRKRGARTARRGRYRGRRVGWGPTKGRRWWTKTVDEIDAELPRLIEREGMEQLSKMWGR
jgi:hypothetical protein